MDKEIVSLWNQFEIKFLLCCTKYKQRYEKIVPELARVGITDYIVQWDVPETPIKDILRRNIRVNKFLQDIGPFSCCLSHYKAIKTAQGLGVKSCLIMEDDIRFRLDIDILKATLGSLPQDYDYAQFENVKPYEMELGEYLGLKDKNIINKQWRRFVNLRGGGCYAMSKIAISRMAEAIEDRITGRKGKLKINDRYISKMYGLNKYFCFPPLAIQKGIGNSNSDVNGYLTNYELLGLKENEYANA